MNEHEIEKAMERGKRIGPFRRAVLRGLGILLPPLLTIVIFVWVGHTVGVYMLEPMERAARGVMLSSADIRTPGDLKLAPDGTVSFGGKSYPAEEDVSIEIDGKEYKLTPDKHELIPESVYGYVKQNIGRDPMPADGVGIYTSYINKYWLPRRFVVPLFLCIFVLVLYLLGKFLAAGVGRFFFTRVERVIHRLPLVSNVYSSIKQVTDFIFSEREMEYTRVVAVEYPRKGIWTLGFVTGEGMQDIQDKTDEPVISAFVPHSPMPFTGFAITVRKSKTVDLNISVDQAIQWVVSCGVVIPPPRVVPSGRFTGRERQLALAGTAAER
ncbi:MAG TPA: DUF502 domain-containing protein [Lacipirellulaceae bacterium]|nr:DUF502 domain-containing protein [Lacipirellulaceae bacterium]